MDGHECHLTTSVEGNAARACRLRRQRLHGLPAHRRRSHQAQIEAVRLIDPLLDQWAESCIADRVPA